MRAANFVEETTTSIAGTNGDGAITLTQIAGLPRFSHALGAGATAVRYVIESATTGYRETGIGTVAANVLTRTRPQITWDGTTWDDSTPAPLAFGSAPTSGNVLIRMGPTAEAQAPTVFARQTTLAGDAWRDYPISPVIQWGNTGTGELLTANREHYHAYKLETAGALTGLQLEVTAAVAASNIALALYSLGSNGLPGAKMLDFAGFLTDTTGIKTDTNPAAWTPVGQIWLIPGWYVIGFIASHAITIRGGAVTAVSGLGQTPFGRQSGYGYADVVYAAGAGTALPANPAPTAVAPSGATPSKPWIGLRVVP